MHLKMDTLIVLKFTAAVLLSVSSTSCEYTEVVHTRSGPIVGKQILSSAGNLVSAFYGVPYGEAPIGDLRFAPPREAPPWTSTYNATEPNFICYQQFTESQLRIGNESIWGLGSTSEDCLRLNVFVPHPTPENAPVVVFIHGGGFLIGSPLAWVDHTVLPANGVITVAVNYRLGVFGFYSLGTAEAPGNVGLLDQVLAMKWVQKNIDIFGGDKSSVTLWGASAGSGAVGYHLLSPESRGLFHKTVMISGTPLNSWAFREREKMIKKSEDLLSQTDCSSSGLECLKAKSPEDVLKASVQPDVFLSEHFLPTIDGTFLIEPPDVSVKAGRINEAGVLLGNSIDDGAPLMVSSNGDVITTPEALINSKDFVTVVKRSELGMTDLQAKVLSALYTDWSDPDDPVKIRDAAKSVYNDGLFICGINWFADGLAAHGNAVYKYIFDYKTTAASALAPDLEWMKATHASEQILLIGDSSQRFNESENDIEVKTEMLNHFLNFIKTGNCNEPQVQSLRWPKYDNTRKAKHFSASSVIEENYRVQECAIWSEVLPLLKTANAC